MDTPNASEIHSFYLRCRKNNHTWKNKPLPSHLYFFISTKEFEYKSHKISAGDPLMLESGTHYNGVILATPTKRIVFLHGSSAYDKAKTWHEDNSIRQMTYGEFIKLIPHFTKRILNNEIKFIIRNIINNYWPGLVNQPK